MKDADRIIEAASSRKSLITAASYSQGPSTYRESKTRLFTPCRIAFIHNNIAIQRSISRMSIARKRKQREIIVISSDEDEPESRRVPKRQRSSQGTDPSSWVPTATEPLADTNGVYEQTLTESLSKWTTEALYAQTKKPDLMCTLSSRQVAQRLLDARLQDPEALFRFESNHPCLAVCSTCVPKKHLERFNSKLHLCQGCRMVYPRWTHTCLCRNYRLEEPEEPREPEASNELRAAVEASGLSKLAQHVLLLVSQVPVGHYTTLTALKEWYSQSYHMTPKSHIASALRKNVFAPDVPDHRVVDSNGGIGRFIDWGDHGEHWEVRREMLAEEGMRFDKNGRLLGASFTSFR